MTHPTPEEIEAAVAGIKQLIELAEPEGPHYVEPEQVSQLRTLLSAVEQAQGMRKEALVTGWRCAMTAANNLCVNISDRHNADDEMVEADVANNCAVSIRKLVDPDDQYIADMSAALSSSLPPDPLLVEARNAQNKAPDVVFQALVDAREYFAERADAEYFTDSPRAHGNTEMQLMSAMDEALAALNRAATGEKQ